MNSRLGVCAILCFGLAACNTNDTASTNSDDWMLDDNKTSMDMGNRPDQGIGPLDQGVPPVDQGMPPVDQGIGPLDQALPVSCGDGVIDADETCDGDCPASVDECPAPPPEACARVGLIGDAASCNAECNYFQETQCISDDGCCPAGCDNAQDNDCGIPERCGNGMIDDGETCDGDCYQDAGECPDLPLPDACTRVVLAGNAAECSVECTTETITTFDDTDGCCPQGGTPQLDSDCIMPPMCGNGVVEAGEQCDGDCPMSDADCDDFNACTTDSVMGDAAMCQAMCVGVPITSCVDNDGCCAPGCTGQQDSDCVETDLCNVLVPTQLPYGHASVVDSLALGGSSTGFDYTGDGQTDNALGGLLDGIGALIGASRADFNQELAARIAQGDLALVMEHEQLTGLVGGVTPFTINVLQGDAQCFMGPDPAGANFYRILPTSYDAQGAVASQLMPATLDMAGQLSADDGQISLPFDLVGLVLDLRIEGVKMDAVLDLMRSSLPTQGVALNSGVLGGYVTFPSLFDSINDAVDRDCTCVIKPAGADLISYNTGAGGLNASCNSSFNASACTGRGVEGACSTIVDNCSLLVQVLPGQADVDSTAPGSSCGGSCDSMSVGFTFSASGARILGDVAP